MITLVDEQGAKIKDHEPREYKKNVETIKNVNFDESQQLISTN